MMYGEVRGGISEHTLVCGNTTSSSSERKRIRWIDATRQRLAASASASGLTKAIVPDGIIAQQSSNFKSRHEIPDPDAVPAHTDWSEHHR